MASTSIQDAVHAKVKSDSKDQSGTGSRYQPKRWNSSSYILRSFTQELQHFGQGASREDASSCAGKESVSNPTSPRRGSVPNTSLEVQEETRPRSSSDPRRLSLPQVKEEVGEQGTGSENTGAVTQLVSQDVVPKSQGEKSKLLSIAAADMVDGAMVKGGNLPLTKQVMEWFTRPQPQAKVTKTELNAMCPTSF